jgi:hypothetical protein
MKARSNGNSRTHCLRSMIEGLVDERSAEEEHVWIAQHRA